MAYGLPRKHTVKSVLHRSCYKVQEPWELALLTKTLYSNMANTGVPLFEDVYSSPFKTNGGKKTKDAALPTAETIENERAYELKHLNEIKLQKNATEKVQSLLRDKKIGLRRPLTPKK
ncbi:uncharacterized protein C4orf36 homolog [Macrotis lagotis]|uniref:uncharacterized protein C4orf36 homolog n=1 Tax=Macrotis lagotis TaxID=92651 RepID=UPI003D693CA8